MRIALLTLVLLVPLAAQAQDEAMERGTYDTRVVDLGHRAEQLASDIARARTALAVIGTHVFEEHGVAQLRLVHENRMGPLYRLVRAEYAIDGRPVFARADASGALDARDEIEIYTGGIAPGEHVLSLRLEYVGAGGRVVSYLEGYHFVIRSSHHFTAADGRVLRLRVVAYERDATRAYVDRPTVGYRESLTRE